MTRTRRASFVLLLAALAVGTLSDKSARHGALYLGGYRVLSGDFHLHPFPLSASTLSPWDLAWDAAHNGLDVVAITGQNEVWTGRAARWMVHRLGGPIVIAGEEIHGPIFHMIAARIHSTIGWRGSAAGTIAEIHRQGGVAIAAHPTAGAWPAYDQQAMDTLDGAEVWQPAGFDSGRAASEMRQFYARRPLAAVASSDWHGIGPPGNCRTWLFVHDASEAEVLQAIREHRTVVFDGHNYYGDPVLVELARADGRLAQSAPPSPWGLASRICALAGLLALIASTR